MMRALLASMMVMAAASSCAAQTPKFWRCRFGYGSGTWQVIGATLLGPPHDVTPESPRYAVVSSSNGFIVALSEVDSQRRFALVTLDTRTGQIKVRHLGPENTLPERLSENGQCVKADGMASTTRR
ncbi:MAG: hypothetical protein JO256_14030 [Alphaproteobacteria bacterium]|nr:hypothetical protein [Alphaproteobacteria bacterium]